jgi:hypothetical protein
VCGEHGEGQGFDTWVKDTFTNHDILHPGKIICQACLFWFNQKSDELQLIMGKDKPQRMQNYSHFVIGGKWQPVSKGNKRQMADLLLATPFPELAAIAVSGQKHIAFRARRNAPGQSAGWVQYEEQAVWVDPVDLAGLLGTIEELYTVFSKGEIESGRYYPRRILDFGLARWDGLEKQIKSKRNTILFQLALYLAQRSDDDDGDQSGDHSDAAQDHLAGDTGGLQEPLPNDHLGAIRERNSGGSLHQQPGEVYQLDLFQVEGRPGTDGGGEGCGG